MPRKSAKPPLRDAYRRLLRHFGPQGWWPARTKFEILVGAILTQHTNWRSVERAIRDIRAARRLSLKSLLELSHEELAELIRKAGPNNVKARRLRNLLEMIQREYGGSLRRMAKEETPLLREKLLAVNGVGPETADSILLYAFDRPVFVIDAYTKRVVERHGWTGPNPSYDEMQQLFEQHLKRDPELFNEYHALIVTVGGTHCRTKPICEGCPLECLL